MKTNLKTAAGFMIILFAAHPLGFAEWIDAEVMAVNKANQTLELRKFDERGHGKNMTVKIENGAQWTGYRDLNAIKNGDRVRLDVKQSFFGGARAKAVTASNPAAPAATAAADAKAKVQAEASKAAAAAPKAAQTAQQSAQNTANTAQAAAGNYVPSADTLKNQQVRGQVAAGGVGVNGSVNSAGGTVGTTNATTGIRANSDTAGSGRLTGPAGATTGVNVQGTTGIQGKSENETGSAASQSSSASIV